MGYFQEVPVARLGCWGGLQDVAEHRRNLRLAAYKAPRWLHPKEGFSSSRSSSTCCCGWDPASALVGTRGSVSKLMESSILMLRSWVIPLLIYLLGSAMAAWAVWPPSAAFHTLVNLLLTSKVLCPLHRAHKELFCLSGMEENGSLVQDGSSLAVMPLLLPGPDSLQEPNDAPGCQGLCIHGIHPPSSADGGCMPWDMHLLLLWGLEAR